MSCWPRQVSSDCRVSLSLVTVARVIALTFTNGNTASIAEMCTNTGEHLMYIIFL